MLNVFHHVVAVSVEVDKVKAAMAGFALPAAAQPEWTKSISDDEWKRKLYEKLNIPLNTREKTAAADCCQGDSLEAQKTDPNERSSGK